MTEPRFTSLYFTHEGCKLTEKSDRCPKCTSTNGEAYDDEYISSPNHSDKKRIACRVFSCRNCGETTDFAWYDVNSEVNPSAVIDNINEKYEEESK